jgi:hypothetical protein
MSHNKNGKTSHGQNISRKVDDFSAGNNGPRKLKSYLIARPNEVHEFLRNMYLICLEDCSSSGIDEIFGENGGSGNYPIFVQPEDPVGDNKVEFEKWKQKFGEYNKKKDALVDHKIKLFGVLLKAVSRESYVKIQENSVGKEAMSDKCPKKLLEAIRITHMTDNKGDVKAQLFEATELYGHDNEMGKLSLSDYYTRFLALVENIRSISNRISNEEFMEDSTPSDEQQAYKFVKGLSYQYDNLIDNIQSGLVDMPGTVAAVYTLAANCKLRTKDTSDEKMLLIARKQIKNENKNKLKNGQFNNKNNNEKSGGKEKSLNQNEYGGRKGNCNTCHTPGHYSHECKETVDVHGKKIDGGKGNTKTV